MSSRIAFCRALIVLAAASVQAAPLAVGPSRDSFNPTLRQTIELQVTSQDAGLLTLRVLDRDGYAVRNLVTAKPIDSGTSTFVWDGRDDSGLVVPDEAWSFRADLLTSGGNQTFFPAASHSAGFGVKAEMYDPASGILKYTLKVPSRVHVQAGTSDDTSKDPAGGAVLKTIVNRAPRPAGSVIEHWNGFDESGAIFVPDLARFVVAIAATPLPEGSVITTGNRSRTFLSSLVQRQGVSLLAHRETHDHHGGLTARDDLSPSLSIKPLNATLLARTQASFTTTKRTLQLHIEPTGPTAERFVEQPAKVQIYVDGRLAREVPARGRSMRVSVPIAKLAPGQHVVAVNWGSAHGPLAANAFLLNR